MKWFKKKESPKKEPSYEVHIHFKTTHGGIEFFIKKGYTNRADAVKDKLNIVKALKTSVSKKITHIIGDNLVIRGAEVIWAIAEDVEKSGDNSNG